MATSPRKLKLNLNQRGSLLYCQTALRVPPPIFPHKQFFSIEDKNILQPYKNIRGARGVMVIVVGNGYGDTSSNPGQG